MFSNSNVLNWIIACGGWIVAIFLAYLGYSERRSAQQKDLLLKTVAYFEGGTEKRSIGIALIEGLLQKEAKNIAVLIPLLTNQFVYLLLHPDVKDSVHEERNLVRLFLLLRQMPGLRDKYHHSWCEIGDAIGRRLSGEESELKISKPTLRLWMKDLGHMDPIED